MIFKIHNGQEQTEFEHDPPESVHVVGHVASAVEYSNNNTVSLLKNKDDREFANCLKIIRKK